MNKTAETVPALIPFGQELLVTLPSEVSLGALACIKQTGTQIDDELPTPEEDPIPIPTPPSFPFPPFPLPPTRPS